MRRKAEGARLLLSPTDRQRTLGSVLPPIVNSDPGDETGAE